MCFDENNLIWRDYEIFTNIDEFDNIHEIGQNLLNSEYKNIFTHFKVLLDFDQKKWEEFLKHFDIEKMIFFVF